MKSMPGNKDAEVRKNVLNGNFGERAIESLAYPLPIYIHEIIINAIHIKGMLVNSGIALTLNLLVILKAAKIDKISKHRSASLCFR